MERAHRFQRFDAEVGPQQEQREVGRVEKAGLAVGHMRRATVEMRVPQGELAGVQAFGGEAVGRQQERDQIAPIRGHVGAVEPETPREADAGQRQHAGGRDIQSPRSAAPPVQPAGQQVEKQPGK